MHLTETEKYNVCQQALSLKTKIEDSFISLGGALLEIKEKGLFDSQWETFADFLMEMKLSENMANKLMQIYKVFVLGYGFTPKQLATVGGWSALQEILPMVKTKADAKKWLFNATTMTQTDLRRTVLEEKRGKDMTVCKHPNTYLIRVCRDCGLKTHELI